MKKNVKEEKETLIEKYLRYQRDMMEAEKYGYAEFFQVSEQNVNKIKKQLKDRFALSEEQIEKEAEKIVRRKKKQR